MSRRRPIILSEARTSEREFDRGVTPTSTALSSASGSSTPSRSEISALDRASQSTGAGPTAEDSSDALLRSSRSPSPRELNRENHDGSQSTSIDSSFIGDGLYSTPRARRRNRYRHYGDTSYRESDGDENGFVPMSDSNDSDESSEEDTEAEDDLNQQAVHQEPGLDGPRGEEADELDDGPIVLSDESDEDDEAVFLNPSVHHSRNTRAAAANAQWNRRRAAAAAFDLRPFINARNNQPVLVQYVTDLDRNFPLTPT
ncbi:hypothetical protein BKA63DRAFT_561559 [Paraphoma chrysanthemicola]|nr:hypothetical protein BKA63DRAFT_561559 [Paraphoma chrysanthemicola]